jgi:hypothetical protein
LFGGHDEVPRGSTPLGRNWLRAFRSTGKGKLDGVRNSLASEMRSFQEVRVNVQLIILMAAIRNT